MANIKDFATALIATAPSPANSGTSLVLDAGMGARMPAVPFAATIHPEGEIPTLDNAEKVNVTDVVVDTLTIQRAQGQTTAKNIGVGWRISNAIFASDLDLSTYQLKPIEGAFVDGDKTKLDGIEAGAQVNTVTSVSGKTGAVTLDKTDVGLSNVDNTSDANKPVSTATQTALNGKGTLLNVPQFSVPYKSTAGTGEANTNLAVRDSAATPGSIAARDGTGAVHVATATATTHAVNKSQMDTADALKVNKAGDTMTGALNTTDVRPTSASTYNLGQTTNRYFHVFTERIRLGNTELSMLSGTGFPEGVVTANVGSIYIDTAITNGASSWIKKSGTGNTGWKVLEGDTGWRDIRTTLDSSVWSQTEGDFAVRRVNGTVYVRFRNVLYVGSVGGSRAISRSFTNNMWPAGFGYGVWQGGINIYGGADIAGVPSKIINSVSQSDLSIQAHLAGITAGNWSATDKINGLFNYPTDQAWPTTLPGV